MASWFLFLFLSCEFAHGFVPINRHSKSLFRTTTTTRLEEAAESIIFDLTKESSLEAFERIDDVIMGGVSSSTLRAGDQCAIWSGIVRIDGGGFCGVRTLPFEKPIEVDPKFDGFYLHYCFKSDDEPERRVWKMVTRTEASRGEEVYQAQFQVVPSSRSNQQWEEIKIPFDSFRQVRGPRLVQDGVPLDVSKGLYQVGLSLSKFEMAQNMTELSNFRPGYFEMHLKDIGFYSPEQQVSGVVEAPTTLNATQAKKQQPVLFQILQPVFKLFFSESKRRRRYAFQLLQQKRGMSKWQAFKFGLRKRIASMGLIKGLSTTTAMVGGDVLSAAFLLVLKVMVVYPVIAISRLIKFFKKTTSITSGNKENAT